MMKRLPLISSWLLITLMPLGVSACYPISQGKQRQQASTSGLTLLGNVSGTDRKVDLVSVYMEQESEPEAVTAADGSFQLFFTPERLRELERRYHFDTQPLHIYFERPASGSLPSVGALMEVPYPSGSGRLELGAVTLTPKVRITGQLRGALSPEVNTVPFRGGQIQVGRAFGISDEDGHFALDVPQDSILPVRVRVKGFVESRGLWPTGTLSEDRSFTLFENLTVDGELSVPLAFRQKDPFAKFLDLSVYANAMVSWVRIGSDASVLEATESSQAPWRAVDRSLRIPMFGTTANFVYQFADRDRKVLSPIHQLTVVAPVAAGTVSSSSNASTPAASTPSSPGGNTDPNAGNADPNAGNTDPNAGNVGTNTLPDTGTIDPNTGLPDPNAENPNQNGGSGDPNGAPKPA